MSCMGLNYFLLSAYSQMVAGCLFPLPIGREILCFRYWLNLLSLWYSVWLVEYEGNGHLALATAESIDADPYRNCVRVEIGNARRNIKKQHLIESSIAPDFFRTIVSVRPCTGGIHKPRRAWRGEDRLAGSDDLTWLTLERLDWPATGAHL